MIQKLCIFVPFDMKVKKKIIQYVLLLASMVMLLSVIVPHHHHRDGMPCYKPLTTAHQTGDSHGCGCEGHGLFFLNASQSVVTDVDAGPYLFPLLVLFDYIYPPEPAFYEQRWNREKAVYIESLHDTWIASASGRRGPPVW